MNLLKKHSLVETPVTHKLKHTISDITSDSLRNKIKHNTLTHVDQQFLSQIGTQSQFFNLIGYDCFLNQKSDFKRSFGQNKQKQIFQDRFIPNRKTSSCLFDINDQISNDENDENANKNEGESTLTVMDIYKKHILGLNNDNNESASNILTFKNNNILKFNNSSQKQENPAFVKKSSYGLCEQLSSITSQKHRKIAKMPIKVLDAPALQDDFYLNLIDWSEQNLLAVGLSSSVYLWSAVTSKVNKLCDLGLNDTVTAVSWTVKGPLLGIGTNSGEVQIWDTVKMKKTRTLTGHTNRIGAIAWNSNIFSSGSRDKTILHRDLRVSDSFISKLIGHKQQVCGLKWSPDQQQLCSGGNDNKLLIWNAHSCQPIIKFSDHTAAVKAMAWSPHQHGLLASGGGTADRTIRFWNTLSGSAVNTVDTGSQVCNLMFSKTVNELVSTHGYSQNQINIWKYPKMQKISTLTGHTYRVLYLAMSPDGTTIVTGAGDETLRFWNVFPSRDEKNMKKGSILQSQTNFIR